MGIPSYYRQLCSSVAGLVTTRLSQNGSSAAGCDHLWIDFNCMIYHCINRLGMPKRTEFTSDLAYEERLGDEVLAYLFNTINVANPKNSVFIAVDGVVPAAKRRQQRLRRWETESSTSGSVSWNKNKITPGTAFMERFHERMQHFVSEREADPNNHLQWALSGYMHAGEGEHKIARMLRKMGGHSKAIHYIYGLDADLILLTMLSYVKWHPEETFYLYRENMENGEVVYNDGTEERVVFNINVLTKYIASRCHTPEDAERWVIDYIFIMSLLGNDFVPCYTTLSFKDDGHTTVMKLLGRVWGRGMRLVAEDGGSYCLDGLLNIFEQLEKTEEESYKRIYEKKKAAVGRGKGRGEDVCQIVEDIVFKANGGFLEDWRDRVYTHFSDVRGSGERCGRELGRWYKYGLEWILDYYMGRDVDIDWYYPSWITPFAKDMIRSIKMGKIKELTKVTLQYPTPHQQLALVMPPRDVDLNPIRGLHGFAACVWSQMPEVTTYNEFMKWRGWERGCKIASPLLSDLHGWNQAL
jgi:5'-3' exonuclease